MEPDWFSVVLRCVLLTNLKLLLQGVLFHKVGQLVRHSIKKKI